MLVLKTLVKVTEYNMCNVAIRWEISMSMQVIFCIFALALSVCKILTFQSFDLENLDQGHRVQLYSDASIKVRIFYSRSQSFRDVNE